MKRFFAAFAAFVLASLILIPTQVKASTDLLVDEADLLTSSEEQELENLLQEISDRQKVDVAAVLVTDTDGKSVTAYGDYLMEQNYGRGSDNASVILVITSDGERYIGTSGKAMQAITDSELDQIINACLKELNQGNYAAAVKAYAKMTDSSLTKKFPWFKNILISLGIALLLALIITSVMKSKLKSVRANDFAADYVVPGSLNVKQSYEIFLYSKVHSVRRQNNNNNGSTTHTSSSGTTHGGKSF